MESTSIILEYSTAGSYIPWYPYMAGRNMEHVL